MATEVIDQWPPGWGLLKLQEGEEGEEEGARPGVGWAEAG